MTRVLLVDSDRFTVAKYVDVWEELILVEDVET
jgi:hypothetical protein